MRLMIGVVCLVSLLVLKHQVTAGCSMDTLRQVNALLKKAPQLSELLFKQSIGLPKREEVLDCELYTPNATDYQNCPRSTILCFAEEIKVLTEEWESVRELQRLQLNWTLKKLAQSFNQAESKCLQCELHERANATTFLSNLEGVLKEMNSRFC